MHSFEDLFFESGGRPIEYQGRTLVLVDVLPVRDSTRLKVVFEDSNSEWRQGLMLRTEGIFLVGGQEIKDSIALWEDTAPNEVEFSVRTANGELEVRNVWDVGDGVMHSWHNGAAMFVEDLANGRRYSCNDGHPDENLDDVVFRILEI